MSDIPPPTAPVPPSGSQPPPPGYAATLPGSVPPPGAVPPPPAAPTKPTGGLAIAALVISIIAFLTGLVPVLGMLLGAAAVALGILALRARQSKGMSITALILGGLAVLTSLGMTLGLSATLSNAGRDIPAPAESAQQAQPSEAPAEETEPEPEPEEPAPAADAGTATNPLPQPYVAKGLLGGEKYSLTAKVTNAAANEQVEAWNMFNSEAPAGYKYVIVEMTMTGIDPDGVEPSLATFDLSLATAEGNRYDSEYIVFGEGMPSMTDGPTLYPGNSFTGYSAYIVPDSATAFLLYDNANYVVLP